MMDRETIVSAWERHCKEGWPQFSSPNEGQLMTLDTVISGCVSFYLDSADGLDPQRRSIVEDCLVDLEELILELDTTCQEYFSRLRELGKLLLESASG